MKKKAWSKTAALGLSLTLALLWVLGSRQPLTVAAPGAPASGAGWDGLGVYAPAVILDGGVVRMWYDGRALSFYGWGFSMGYAESPDGKTWTKHPSNPVLEPGESGHWDSAYRGQAAVIKDGSTYKMWYSGGPSSGSWQVGYATSNNGLDWSVHAGNPVLHAGGPGSWDEMECDGPTVIKDGATYKMWYFGCDADYLVCSIGYATSPDGVNWTKHPGNPVLQATAGSWDKSGLSQPRVIKDGATYLMWYYSDYRLGLATSPDGINWTKHGNPVLEQSWSGAGVLGAASVLLDGSTYKMWFRGGAAATTGIGYAESSDGITWTQPVSNPRLQRGETGLIVAANYDNDWVEAYTLGNTPLTITVSHAGGVKATISGVTEAGGRYRTRQHEADWNPARPDILPGDSVSATAGAYSTTIETVGAIDAQAHSDTDDVEGALHAPWFAPGALAVLCEVWVDPSQTYLDRDVPADGGSFLCDFSGLTDIAGGVGGQAAYLEPDGDMVAVDWQAPYMEVYYGTRDGVGAIYAPGHSFSIRVANAAGATKATATIASTSDGGRWGHGFRPWWTGGDCCAWSPAAPDIQPGDRVHFESDDGYANEVRVGTIYGTIDVAHDSVTGPIYAYWLSQMLEVWCGPQTLFPPEWRQSSAKPDGSVPYLCEWPAADPYPWDIQPNSDVMVGYFEPDHDHVIRMMRASEGAPPRHLYLPLVVRQ